MEYTVTLTNAENIAMEFIAADVNEWINNAAKVRANIAITDIQTILLDHCNANSIAMAVGTDAQVQQAYDLGLLVHPESE